MAELAGDQPGHASEVEPQEAEPQEAEPREAEPREAEQREAEPREAEPREAETLPSEPPQAEPREAEPREAETLPSELPQAAETLPPEPPQAGEPRAEPSPRLAPGVYRVLHDVDVTAGPSVHSGDVAELLQGAAVTVLEVAVLLEERRIRGLVDEPQGWASLASLGGSRRWAQPVLCGAYCVLRGVDVSAGMSLESEDTGAVEDGKIVKVMEVVHCRPESRVRGLIADPPGWISLLNTDNGGEWAVHVEQEDDEVRAILSEQPGLFKSCSLPYSALRRALRRSHKKLNAAHKEATEAWRGPLSLFARATEAQARDRGVPDWAIECVYRMQQLVDAAAELHDLADVYEAQINKAESSGRGLHRASLRIQLERLDELSQRLRSSTPRLRAAREAFDEPDNSPKEAPRAVEDPEVENGKVRAGREVIIEQPSKIGASVASASRSVWRSLSASISSALSPASGSDQELEQRSSFESEGRCLRRVAVQAGSLVYSLGFEYSDGTARTSLSGWGGEEKEPLVLEAGEYLVGVRGRQGLALDAIRFVTSRGRESETFGNKEGGSDFSLDASEGFQICSVERNFAGRIVRLIEVPAPSQ